MSLRTQLLRLAHSLPAKSEEQKQVLALLGDKTAAKYRDKGSIMNAVYALTDEVGEIRRSMLDLGAPAGRPSELKTLQRALHDFEGYVDSTLG